VTDGTKASMWGGRFAREPDALFRAFNDSLAVDWALLRQDVRGSIAWARALAVAGVLAPEEFEGIEAGLRVVEAKAGEMGGAPETGEEDVHSWVEARLIEAIGDAGKKLHTGRSRNDQVATDLRMWTREAIDERTRELCSLMEALLDLAERNVDTPMPAYTHLQPAQPVLAAHWALAYVEMLERDADRLRDARARVNVCPLGCAALAGTTWPVDREAITAELGFDEPCRNSLDAVADRDFVFETISGLSLCLLHLSRLAEELIVFASREFGLVQMDDSVTSGSSLMPQKKNPDAMELVRAKAGVVLGRLAGLGAVLKGVPLAYNKDLQEDKPALFESMATASMCLRMTDMVIRSLRLDGEACRRAALAGGAGATELADYLVSKGTPFREAHGLVGRAVRRAEELGIPLEELDIEELRVISPMFEADCGDWMTLERTLSRRSVSGGTAPARVREALAQARARVAGRLRAIDSGGTA